MEKYEDIEDDTFYIFDAYDVPDTMVIIKENLSQLEQEVCQVGVGVEKPFSKPGGFLRQSVETWQNQLRHDKKHA